MSQSSKNKDGANSNADRPDQRVKSQWPIWLSLAVIGSLLSLFLSWPWWRDFSYWAESRLMWAIYFAVGFVLAVYVFYAFFGSMRTLFEHDAIEREALDDKSPATNPEDRS